jgi:hypothetical protein
MRRLCDRPGCSAPAALVYRMVPERLVFWMAPIDDEVETDGGVICQRHADRLVLPRGWTLDDRRDPTLRLFRPSPEADRADAGPRLSRRTRPEPVAEQLAIGVDAEDSSAVVAPRNRIVEHSVASFSESEEPLDDEASVDQHPEEQHPQEHSAADTSRPSWAPARGAPEPPEGEVRSSLLARAFGMKRRG